LSRPDPAVPLGDERPPFDEPWQAEAFALAVHLSAAGVFSWIEWAAALAAEIAAAGPADDGTRYYEHWQAALERLMAERGLIEEAALDARTAAWADAYRTTPHGKPVVLPPAG
jgi:nitrile hydratase accessory protein